MVEARKSFGRIQKLKRTSLAAIAASSLLSPLTMPSREMLYTHESTISSETHLKLNEASTLKHKAYIPGVSHDGLLPVFPGVENAPQDEIWDRLAECESSGNWSINTGNGYYGGLQFDEQTWKSVGGTGLPSEASREEQIYRANLLWKERGFQPWPGCSEILGIGRTLTSHNFGTI